MTYWTEDLERNTYDTLLELPAYDLVLQNTADQTAVVEDLTIKEAKAVVKNLGKELDRMRNVEKRITSLLWRLKNEIGAD